MSASNAGKKMKEQQKASRNKPKYLGKTVPVASFQIPKPMNQSQNLEITFQIPASGLPLDPTHLSRPTNSTHIHTNNDPKHRPRGQSLFLGLLHME
jgi:hypothetical protein